MRKKSAALRRGLWLAGAALWLAGTVFGMTRLWVLDSTPGVGAAPPAVWPADCDLPRIRGQCTILVFLHPHCPCARATVAELASVLAEANGRATIYALFLAPEEMPSGWERTSLWTAAGALPDSHVVADRGGVHGRQFRARTSGQVLAYDVDGRLAFRGGITAGRGHAGDNPGRRSLIALISGHTVQVAETSVFGCPLQDSESEDDSQP